MKTVTIDGETYEGTILYKTDSSISLYNGDTNVVSLDGVNDWSGISWDGELDETKDQIIDRLNETIEDLVAILVQA